MVIFHEPPQRDVHLRLAETDASCRDLALGEVGPGGEACMTKDVTPSSAPGKLKPPVERPDTL